MDIFGMCLQESFQRISLNWQRHHPTHSLAKAVKGVRISWVRRALWNHRFCWSLGQIVSKWKVLGILLWMVRERGFALGTFLRLVWFLRILRSVAVIALMKAYFFTLAGNLCSRSASFCALSPKRNPDVLQRDEAIILLEFITYVSSRREQLNTTVSGHF